MFISGQPIPEQVDYFSNQVDIFADLSDNKDQNLKIFQNKQSKVVALQSDLLGTFGLPQFLLNLNNLNNHEKTEGKQTNIVEKNVFLPKATPQKTKIQIDKNQNTENQKKKAERNEIEPDKNDTKIHKPITALSKSNLTKATVKIAK